MTGVLKLANLTSEALADRLLTDGLTIRTGPFVYTIRTNLPEIASFMGQMYAETPVIDRPLFSDFHLGVHAYRRFASPWRHSVVVSVGGVPLFSAIPRREVFAYMEWGMNSCIARQAHHLLQFHAASLEKNGRGILFPGKTGTGKSTLAAALVARGWRLFSDEFALVAMDSLRLLPLARPIALKNEAIDLIRALDPDVPTSASAEVRRKGLMCHRAPPRESVRRMDEPAIPAAMVFPNFRPGADSRLDAIPKAQAMQRAIECSFNYRDLGRAGFDRLVALVDGCGCYELTYGDLAGAEKALEGC